MTMDRIALLDWLLPHCESHTASIMYAKGANEGPGWVNGPADEERAVAAYRSGTLHAEEFSSITQDGKHYNIAAGSRLGLVPHRDGLVVAFLPGFRRP